MIKLVDILKELNIQSKTPIGQGGEQTAYPSKIKPGFVIKKLTGENEYFTKEDWKEIIQTAQQHPEVFAQVDKVDFDKGYFVQEKLDEKSLTKDGNELYKYLKDNNILYCKNCSIQIQGKEQLFNFSYDMDKKEHKFEPIVHKQIESKRVKEVNKFTENLIAQAKNFSQNTELEKWTNGIVSYNRDFFYDFRGRPTKQDI